MGFQDKTCRIKLEALIKQLLLNYKIENYGYEKVATI
jgi:hypothetical protein